MLLDSIWDLFLASPYNKRLSCKFSHLTANAAGCWKAKETLLKHNVYHEESRGKKTLMQDAAAEPLRGRSISTI
jgi:hypothetical protein